MQNPCASKSGGAEVQMFAPDVSQMHVIDHVKGQPVEKESR